MLLKGVTHVLNVTAREYKKRTKYFKYLNIDVYNKNDEDIKKHFRITNRFIKDVKINKITTPTQEGDYALLFHMYSTVFFYVDSSPLVYFSVLERRWKGSHP